MLYKVQDGCRFLESVDELGIFGINYHQPTSNLSPNKGSKKILYFETTPEGALDLSSLISKSSSLKTLVFSSHNYYAPFLSSNNLKISKNLKNLYLKFLKIQDSIKSQVLSSFIEGLKSVESLNSLSITCFYIDESFLQSLETLLQLPCLTNIENFSFEINKPLKTSNLPSLAKMNKEMLERLSREIGSSLFSLKQLNLQICLEKPSDISILEQELKPLKELTNLKLFLFWSNQQEQINLDIPFECFPNLRELNIGINSSLNLEAIKTLTEKIEKLRNLETLKTENVFPKSFIENINQLAEPLARMENLRYFECQENIFFVNKVQMLKDQIKDENIS